MARIIMLICSELQIYCPFMVGRLICISSKILMILYCQYLFSCSISIVDKSIDSLSPIVFGWKF